MKLKFFFFVYLLDKENVYYNISQVYSAIRNHRIHGTTFFVLMTTILWPHGVWKVVKFQKYCLFWASWPKNICFDIPKVHSAIKNQRIHVTTFFMLRTPIWWPLGVWKLVMFQKYCLFWASWPNKCTYVLICQKHRYSTKKKTGCGHDHINLNYDHKSGLNHNCLLSSIKNIQYLGVSFIFRTF